MMTTTKLKSSKGGPVRYAAMLCLSLAMAGCANVERYEIDAANAECEGHGGIHRLAIFGWVRTICFDGTYIDKPKTKHNA